MGCCQSSDQDENFEPSENDRLLPPSNGSDTVGQQQNGSDVFSRQHKSDEQSKLNEILQHTSSNLIDISAQMVSAEMPEENEARHKAKQYASRLHKVTIPYQPKLSHNKTNPYGILSLPGLPPSDIDLIAQAAQKTADCMKKVVINHKEDLVVPFGVP